MRLATIVLLTMSLSVTTNRGVLADDHWSPLRLIGVLDVSGRYDGIPSPVFGVPVDWLAATWGEETELKHFTVARTWAPDGTVSDAVERAIPILDFLMIETDYEQPHIYVFAKRGAWVEVRVKNLPTWILIEPRDRFVPYTTLITKGLTYLTTSRVTLAKTPGGPFETVELQPGMQGLEKEHDGWTPSVYVLDVRPNVSETSDAATSIGRGWIQIRVTDLPHCSVVSNASERTILEGWVPSHGSSGAVSVWFHSRGC